MGRILLGKHFSFFPYTCFELITLLLAEGEYADLHSDKPGGSSDDQSGGDADDGMFTTAPHHVFNTCE